jgi:hypothetical protein
MSVIIKSGNSGDLASVKSANTAPLASDPAMVVTVSPNSPPQSVSGSVSVSNLPVTQPVSGTFWQTTQPISGSVSVSNLPSTQAVTGTFFQSVQPVSGTVAVSGVSGSVAVTGTFWQVTQPVSGSVTVSGTAAVTQQVLTKGTQGANGVSTQDLKDSGRNVSTLFMVVPVVTTATDALQSLTGYKSGAAVAATTTPAVVTAGKTYRITAITMTYVGIATAGSARFTLRANSAGVVAIGSAPVATWVVGTPGATAGFTSQNHVAFPDGFEFAAGTGIGISVEGLSTTQAAAAVGYAQINIYGFEY